MRKTWYPLILWYDETWTLAYMLWVDVLLMMWWTHLLALDNVLDTLDEVMESLEVGI